MKKFLVVLLSLGLIAAFAASASALDVKFSGQYYVTGQYESNRTFRDTDRTSSIANMWQRARVQTVFTVAEGLKFTTRFDALEKQWGNISQSSAANADRSNSRSQVAGVAQQESLEFEHAYVDFKTGIGMFTIGYQPAGEWGTGFGDEPNSRPRVKLVAPVGPLFLTAIFEKQIESAITLADADGDKYMLAGTYKFKGGEAGLLYVYTNLSNTRPTANYRTTLHSFAPYMKATFGRVYVEGEVIYITGKAADFDNGVGNVDWSGLGAYLKAQMKMGPAYFGAQFGYSSGDDPSTTTKNESGPKSSTSWSPGIIFGDANYRTWSQGGNIGSTTTYNSLEKQNLLAYSIFAGFQATPKLGFDAQLWGMQADQKPTGFSSKKYGYEFDVTATYKIYDNLSYMVGAGYFWAGDYFKGTTTNAVGNDYVLLNKLTLNF